MQQDASVAAVTERYENFVNPALARLFRLMGLAAVEWRAKGMYIVDSTGAAYLDCVGGYGAFSLGHCHAEVIGAVRRQLEYMPLSGKLLLNDKLAELSARLAEFLPELPYSFIVNSGAEAVEGALKLARIHTGRKKIIAMRGAFHGKTLGALSATGRDLFRDPFMPLVPEFVHAEFDDIASLKNIIDERTAAVILEPIQGEGGIIIPAADYLAKVKAVCACYGSLMIADEVQTGLGRTGKLFAVEYDGVMPDIMVMAKALGGGVMPVGAFSARAEIWDKYWENPFLHTSTFGGNQLACVAAVATLDVLRRDYASFEVAAKGAMFLAGLKEMQAAYPQFIDAVRGRGLMLGLALKTEGLGGFLMAQCIKCRILVAYTLNNPKVIRLEPPFIISRAEIQRVLAVLGEIFHSAQAVFGEE